MPTPAELSDATNIIDINPYLLALQVAFDILQQLGIIPDPIEMLIQAFAGKPRSQDTLEMAHRLMIAANPAARLWGFEIFHLFHADNIVISSSSAQDQHLLGEARHQFILNLQHQGFSEHDAHAAAYDIWDNFIQQGLGPRAMEALHSQPSNDFKFYGSQQFKTEYDKGLTIMQQRGFTGDKLLYHAEGYALRHVPWKVLTGISYSNQPPPPPPPPPPGPQGGDNPCTDPCMQQLMTSLDGFFQAVTGSGSPIAILGQHLPHLIQTINNIDLSKGANALEELASCVCPKLDAIAQTISAGDNALHTATENGSQAIADAIDNLRKQEWETQGYFAQLANQGLIDPDVLSVTPQSAAADHPMAFKASAAAMARKASTVNPNLIDMSPEEIVASGTHVKVTKFDNWTDWAISTVESLIGALFKDFLKGFDLVTNTANTLAGDLGRKIEPILKDLFQGDYSAWEFIPRAILNTLESVIEAHGEVNPDNVEDVGLSILGFAFIVGQIMHFGAELGGKLFYPASSVWAHNAEMAIEILGYHEILRSFHGPLFRTAITTSAQYRYNSKFRPNVPSESMGFQALARGHIDEAKLTKLVELNGVHKDWVQPLLDIAYRPISAFIIERLATAGTFTDQEMRDILVDNGIRPKLLPPLEGAFKFLTVQPQQSKYFEAAMNAAKEGAISMAELSQALNDPGLNKQQIHYNTQLVLMQQRMNTATEAERQAEALLGDGAWTPQQAQLFMENAGVQPWRIANIVNLGSAKAQAKAALKAESEDRRLARKAYSEAQRAIEAQFLDGNLSENGTTAALQSALVAFVAEMHQLGQDAAAGEAQLVAGELENAALMELLKARKQGHQVMIYGKLMDRKAGDLLRQRIDTVKEAVIREDMDHANALQNLLNLGIDKAEAATLADHWALQVGKKGSQPLGPNQPKY